MLTDIVRGMFVVENQAQVRRIIRELSQHFGVLDEGLKIIEESGYADRKLTIRWDDGFLAEIRIIHREMAAAKKKGHPRYTKARSLPEDDPERAELARRMHALHDPIREADTAFFTPASRPPARATLFRKSSRLSAEETGRSSVEGLSGSIASSGALAQRAETTRPYSSLSSTSAATPRNRPSGESTRIAGKTRSDHQSSTTTSPTPETDIGTLLKLDPEDTNDLRIAHENL